jgi:hypothetical protein
VAREQHETVDREGSAREEGVVREELHHLLVRRRAHPRERDVRREFACLGFEADALKRGLDLFLEMDQRAVGAHAGPQRARVLATELADARKLELETGRADAQERIVDVVTDVLGHLADEAQGQVELVVMCPASAGDAALQPGEALADGFGQFERDKQPDHQRAPSGRLRRKLMTTIANAAAPKTPAVTNTISS